jgi:ribosome maturation factor RimP
LSDLAEQIWGLVEPYLAAEGVELDDLEVHGGGKLLRVVVDSAEPLELDRIAALSRGIGRLIEEEDPLAGSYTLEVTSPGLERKLRRPEHFEKAVGGEVSVRTFGPVDGDKVHKGRLVSVNGNGFVVSVEGSDRTIAYGDVARARTVFVWEKGEKPGKTG